MQGDFSETGTAGQRQGHQSPMATVKPWTQTLQGRRNDSDPSPTVLTDARWMPHRPGLDVVKDEFASIRVGVDWSKT
jgi:hypothetical protein